MLCLANARVERGVRTALRLLNVTVGRSSNFILDVHLDGTTFDSGAYYAPNVALLYTVTLPSRTRLYSVSPREPQCAQPFSGLIVVPRGGRGV